MAKILPKVREKCNNIKPFMAPYKWEYLFGGIFVLLILFSEMYYDFFATFRHGINFWYALFEGHPLSFYSYAKAIEGATSNRVVAVGAAYDFTIYAFFAVWNFPAYLYERISGNYAESCFVLLAWGKMMLPVLAIVTAGGMKKILEFITGSGEDTAAMLYAYSFSGILILSAYLIGQYDIIGVMFSVYGLYYFLQKDYKKFYLYFSVAVSCKYFAVFLFVCLVLIYEKRILYIVRNVAIGCWLVFVEKLLFSFGKSYESIHGAIEQHAAAVSTKPSGELVAVDLLSSRIHFLFSLKAYMGYEVMSVFMFMVGLIWVYCYLQKREDTYHFYYKIIYIAFCVNAVFIILAQATAYWAVVMLPWMILMIYCRADNRKLNFLLETVGIGSFIIWRFARQPYFAVSENFDGMLLYYLLGKPFYYREGLGTILSKLFEEGAVLASPLNMLRSVFYTCMLILLIINFPIFIKQKTKFEREQEEIGMRGLLAFRTVCMVGALMLPLAVYIIQVVFSGPIANYQAGNQVLDVVFECLRN